MDKILVVDDDLGIQKQLKWSFTGYDVVFADDRASAITQLRRHEPKVITLDLGLPPDPANATEGLAALQEILALSPNTKVIVVTGNNDKLNALKAIELGAYDFYQKPIDSDTIQLLVSRAAQLYDLEKEIRHLSAVAPSMDRIIGNSEQILAVSKKAERIAQTDISTLLLGESGTGKEVFARSIHEHSLRKNKAFVAINCASIPENLLESELFGYEKGAFTGANKTTPGKIESAQGGTLFLDEIGDMPVGLQAKMLRFLQERVIERVGGRSEIPVDIRVICATHRDLPSMVSEEQHRWPGNIRELQNKLKSAVIMTETAYIQPDDLGLQVNEHQSVMPTLNLREVREEAESRAIRHAFQVAERNMSRTAELLGVTRPTLYSLIDKYHLEDIKTGS